MVLAAVPHPGVLIQWQVGVVLAAAAYAGVAIQECVAFQENEENGHVQESAEGNLLLYEDYHAPYAGVIQR